MATLYKQISEEFLLKLSGTRQFDEKQIQQLRALLEARKKLRPDDLLRAITGGTDEVK